MIRPLAFLNTQTIFLKCLVLATLVICTEVFGEKIEEIPVTGVGFGATLDKAIQDALVNAVAQVNGSALASEYRSEEIDKVSVRKERSGNEKSTQATAEKDIRSSNSIESKTKGVVASYKVIAQKQTDAGDFTATVSARIAKLKKNIQLDRKKIAVVWSQSGHAQLSDMLAETVTRLLTSSRKFAVLDRRNDAAIREQLNRIRSGEGSVADQARLDAKEAPEYLAVIQVRYEKKSESKNYTHGYLEFIDYATNQVMFSERKTMIINANKPEKIRSRIDVLAKSLTREIIASVFPPTVVAASDIDITISQGKDFFSKGDQVTVFEWGDVLLDPATGEYLSRDRTEIGKAVITYVDARVSKATLNAQARFNMREISNGKYVVSREQNTDVQSKRKSVSDLLD